MSNKIESSFNLIGLLDGTTLYGILRVDGTPLVQRYNKGTDAYVPDYSGLADNRKPTLVPVIRNTATGDLMVPIPSSLIWKYNGVQIEFDENGLSNSVGWEGVFQVISEYSAVIGSMNVTLPALRVMKNLVPISGYDNDRISVSGTVEIAGNSIQFNDLSKDVIIQESTGNAYDVVITDDKGGVLTQADETLTATVNIYKDGNIVTDTSGFSFKWIKVLATGDTEMGTATTQAVTNADVDNLLTLRCDVYEGTTLVASGYIQITDFSDPYYIRMDITGIKGNAIRLGETATVTPVAVRRSDNSELTGLTYTWTLKDNAGAPFQLTGQASSDPFEATSITVTYNDMVAANMGLSGYVSTTVG